MDPLPEPQSETKFEMLLSHRQVTVILLLLLIVMGLVATMAYIAGRSVAAGHEEEFAKRAARNRVVVPTLTPRPAPTRAAEPPPVTDISTMAVEEPQKGVYLQVGSVDKGVALAFQEFLARRGFSAHVATGATENAFRVLVGPLNGRQEIEQAQAALQKNGFSSFLKRY